MIVIDASAAGALLLPDEPSPPPAIVAAIGANPLLAPAHWPLEVLNLLATAERRGRIDRATRVERTAQARALCVRVSTDTGRHAWRAVVALADDHRLTIYDAAYLEQAVRMGCPLMTHDKALKRAAADRGVETLSWS